MTTIKIQNGSEIRRHLLAEGAKFSDLQLAIAAMFNINTSTFSLKYTDEDNDAVTLANDADLAYAIELSQKTQKLLRITVVRRATPAPTPAPAPAPVETGPTKHNAICDSCNKPIVGIRYKCANCLDYDLCESCEAINGTRVTIHDPTHVFIKSTKPLMAGREQLLPRIVIGTNGNGQGCHVRMCRRGNFMPAACMMAQRAAAAAANLAQQAESLAEQAVKNIETELNKAAASSQEEQKPVAPTQQAAPVPTPTPVQTVPVQTATATEASAPPAIPSAMFASQRRQLQNMGFTDEARVDALLERHSGDIVAVVSELIN